jgi:transcriptional antiterminator NusG
MERVDTANAEQQKWFAVWTRSRQEKVSAAVLENLGIQHFLPLKNELRQWSDRKQKISMPLFNGYVFVRIGNLGNEKIQILKTPGIVGFVGNQKGPTPIPDNEIEAVRTVLAPDFEYSVSPLLTEGSRVRVIRGVLAGIEGDFVRTSSSCRLVISIEMIHQSLVVTVSQNDVELIRPSAQ